VTTGRAGERTAAAAAESLIYGASDRPGSAACAHPRSGATRPI